ncbi:hypothetical protein HM1_0085 [Heliomicrobium modesticaldum Ice1]|uniref:Uncharacterized protein n=1 Tax=Heliobacterium modesticaldum (strain ATCC 51547 / Ice1) TaxID=498761 RepID=B0TI37_HELMI|nr:hypothetical protein HM1_0085 [Heliomicrobium modesticaldum Ice1]
MVLTVHRFFPTPCSRRLSPYYKRRSLGGDHEGTKDMTNRPLRQRPQGRSPLPA